jgi:hypothetical protein
MRIAPYGPKCPPTGTWGVKRALCAAHREVLWSGVLRVERRSVRFVPLVLRLGRRSASRIERERHLRFFYDLGCVR